MTGSRHVLICDDHAIVREALRARLTGIDGLKIVGEAADGREAIALSRELRPDLVIIDIEMPGVDGITATDRILALRPHTRILVFTAHDEPDVAALAAESGAAGFLLKSTDSVELGEAIETVLAGKSWFPGQRKRAAGEDDALARLRRLSPRERQILDLLADGMRADGVADELDIQTATAYTHVRNIVAKLEVGTHTQAVAMATRYAFLGRES